VSPLDTTDRQSFRPPKGDVKSRGYKTPDERSLLRRKTRADRLSLTAAAREIAAAVGHKCADCGRKAVWDVPLAVYLCPSCGTVVSRSIVVRGSVCGVKPLPGRRVQVQASRLDFASGEARAHVSGVRRCNQPHRCPDCASARRIDDARTITTCVGGFRADSDQHRVYLVTLTTPHQADQRLRELRRGVTVAYQRSQTGRKIKRFRSRFAIVSSLRRLEVTHSEVNGWHPHAHCLFFTSRPLSAREQHAMGTWLRRYYGRELARRGLGRPAAWCIDVQEAIDPGDYLAKMGVLEVAGDAGVKQARCRGCRSVQPTTWNHEHERRECTVCAGAVNRNPWQILADWRDHRSKKDRGILRKYYHEIRGARLLTWSRWRFGIELRKAYPDVGAEPQRTLDETLTKAPLALTREAWREIAPNPSRVAALLDAYERHDAAALETVLGDHMPPAELAYFPPDDPLPEWRGETPWLPTKDERRELREALAAPS